MKKIEHLYLSFILLILFQACNGDTNTFSLCGIGVVKPYYFTGLRYKGEIYQIKKEFDEKFTKLSINDSGIAKVRFNVNCNGKLGDLSYEEYDLNYKKSNLNDSIELQITSITLDLDEWIPGVDDKGNPVNSHSFLSFRIKNGKIVEILPK